MNVNRRLFLGGLIATATSGLLLPYEPQRIYSMPSARYVEAVELTNQMLNCNLILPLQKELQVQEIMKWNAGQKEGMRTILNSTHYHEHLWRRWLAEGAPSDSHEALAHHRSTNSHVVLIGRSVGFCC